MQAVVAVILLRVYMWASLAITHCDEQGGGASSPPIHMIATRSILPSSRAGDVGGVEGSQRGSPRHRPDHEQGELAHPFHYSFTILRVGQNTWFQGTPSGEIARSSSIDRLRRKHAEPWRSVYPLSDFEVSHRRHLGAPLLYFILFGFVVFDDLLDFYFESSWPKISVLFPMLSFL